ncbi:hypothetical protein BAE44_0014381 [Dichanthelium oligosanthes]|uniref:C2H2-type domain-containing protein n=1 Tax=Dichanthelium oligosanthes TaxID=888268 RepID=A0A1E5VHJ5_9POAL|nr:hypothetical protein BAE44_0014381 [Dichanthelium oligosanthes]
MVVVEGDEYHSDSDSGDDNVDRFVFLKRQPVPAGHHEEDDRGASSASEDDDKAEDDRDDDGDETGDDEGESERGGGRRKRPLQEIVNDGPPPPKKARIELIAIAKPPSGSESETESDSAPLPCDVPAGESGGEGSHGMAHEHHRAPGRGGEAKNATKKKRTVCGKRRRSPGCEEDGDREPRRAVAAAAAAKTGALPAATSCRFVCNLCERCFGSHQALRGHVLGHRKKAKIAIAAAASLDVDDGCGIIGNCKEETVVAEVNEETANGVAQADKMAVVAARHGKANGGGGSCDEKIKTIDDVAEHCEDVDSDGHEDANGNAGFGHKGNGIAASSHGFANGNSSSNENTEIGAAIPSRKTNRKAVVGTCHEGANGNSNVIRMGYKCKVCGTEKPTGRALGGHMRKHRKRSPIGGGDGGEGRSASPATDADCQISLARLFHAENGLQRENTIGLL